MTSMPTVPLAESNVEQAAAWDGESGEYWAAHAAQFEQSTAAYVVPLLRAAHLRVDSEVLDVGCGTGRLARDAARIAVDGGVLGVDLSTWMIDIARQVAAAEGLPNASFEQADAQIHPFPPGSFDVVVGLTSAMFFGDKAAAFANLASSLRPSGRLALIVWQSPERNPWFGAITTALAAGRDLPAPPPEGAHPFSLTDPDQIRPLLEQAGLDHIGIDSVEAPMHFGATAEQAQQFMLGYFGWLLTELEDADQRRAKDALLATMRAHTTERGAEFPSAGWLITAHRCR